MKGELLVDKKSIKSNLIVIKLPEKEDLIDVVDRNFDLLTEEEKWNLCNLFKEKKYEEEEVLDFLENKEYKKLSKSFFLESRKYFNICKNNNTLTNSKKFNVYDREIKEDYYCLCAFTDKVNDSYFNEYINWENEGKKTKIEGELYIIETAKELKEFKKDYLNKDEKVKFKEFYIFNGTKLHKNSYLKRISHYLLNNLVDFEINKGELNKLSSDWLELNKNKLFNEEELIKELKGYLIRNNNFNLNKTNSKNLDLSQLDLFF